ncbi:hypothetical protein SmJEL517_g01166 [Synchytrium microbalum]|uniref:18S rRNA biogenesis protein RCL1 n=1 Tax=Synchytrium microbalum TaxID=1806994 RepID=A0A507C5A0_9FUNG|nr:uncharacterized protein SmJEL517_g01166 [Synchytrium microbalum]TPX36730.1 hypothetical protein SmJEL517_g01166 [Synchytrium microbalum]
MVGFAMVQVETSKSFRQRLLLSTLSGKAVRIGSIREDEDTPGLRDYEISYLRLLEKVTNGCVIEISYSGTTVVYRPGVITGGKFTHDCPNSRGIGYFLEPLIALAPFAKTPLAVTLNGVTNDNLDVSVDTLRTVTLPQLKRFGIEDGLELKISKRGASPNGGGQVFFRCPTVRQLKTLQLTEEGTIKRIRGIAYATRLSPQMANRVVESARSLLTRYIPDVYIYTDVYKGPDSGNSPGYALTLVAESTTDVLLSAECAFRPRPAPKSDMMIPALTSDKPHNNHHQYQHNNDPQYPSPPGSPAQPKIITEVVADSLQNDYAFPTPEDLGIRTARLLLQEIKKGGCVDTISQWMVLLFMAMGPEDVGKVRLGALSTFTQSYLRDIQKFLGVTFKITPDQETRTVLLSCVGSGSLNVSKSAS